MTTIKEKLTSDLAGLNARVTNPDRKSNVGALLFEIYAAQELSALAEKKAEAAWAELHAQGLIASDDKLRQTEGERIEAESDHFTALVKVGAPRETFDRDRFIAQVAKKCKVHPAVLTVLADSCKKEGKAPLSKKFWRFDSLAYD